MHDINALFFVDENVVDALRHLSLPDRDSEIFIKQAGSVTGLSAIEHRPG
jgi:hypothetical protein